MLNTAAATSNILEVLDAVFMIVPFVKLMLSSYLTISFAISFLTPSQTRPHPEGRFCANYLRCVLTWPISDFRGKLDAT
jgi:hypothetical protein